MVRMNASILSLLVLAVFAIPATADIWPPVNVVAVSGPQYAEPGKPLSLEIEITGSSTVSLSGFRVEGKSWQAISLEAPAVQGLEKNDHLVISMTIVGDQPEEPVLLAFEIDGRTWRKSLDLSPKHFELITKPQPLVSVTLPGTQTWVRHNEASPDPTIDLYKRRSEKSAVDSPVKPEAGRRTIRVHGRLLYTRSDNISMGVDGLSVHVYDKEAFWDNEVATGVTDAEGFFDLSFDWFNLIDPDPDLFIRFVTENSKIAVKDATDEQLYVWTSGTMNDFSGTDWDLGNLQPGAEAQFPAVHLLTDLVRNWRWDLNEIGTDNPFLTGFWPEGSTGAYYTNNTVHISTQRQWNETTHAHEYGHFWMDTYGVLPPASYCNGICDDAPDDCGHCMWCEENSGVALLEGWAEWCGDVKSASYLASYGVMAQFLGSTEDLNRCFFDAQYGIPSMTEGFTAALLRDIQDSEPDSSGVFPGGKDCLALGFDEIYSVISEDQPLTPLSFLVYFQQRYPSHTEDLWATAWNCGYDIDAEQPELPTNITSSSHELNEESTDPTVEFNWTGANDDASGVDHYQVLIWPLPENPRSHPYDAIDIGNGESWTSGILSPGRRYFNIVTFDRSGKYSEDYASFGPIFISEPEPAELEFIRPDGWDHRLVVRQDNGATATEAQVSPTLTGEAVTTYWNVTGINNGEADISEPISAILYVDGIHPGFPNPWPDVAHWTNAPPGEPRPAVNKGPFIIRGGRHLLSAVIDANDNIAEGNESNNWCGSQCVWTPASLVPDVPSQRLAPPDKLGGNGQLDVGQVFWYNCDGLQAETSGWWSAVTIHSLNINDDYDLRMHEATTGSEDGFGSSMAWSARGAGLLDAVIANRNTQGTQTRDLGVINMNAGTSNYRASLRLSEQFDFGDSTAVSFDQFEMLKLLEVHITEEDIGYVNPVVTIDPALGPVTLMWLDRSYTNGALSDDNPLVAISNDDGVARLETQVTEPGYYCVVLYRDPASGTGTMTANVEIQRLPPDFVPYLATGWHAPMVPRPANDGSSSAVAQPDTLYGNIASTYMNLAVRNESPTSRTGLVNRLFFDGVYHAWITYGNFGGYSNSLFNWGNALTVRGGRHTLSMRLDDEQLIEEINEDNNIYSEQYCWSPELLALNSSMTRASPPNRTGGWDHFGNGEALWYNCDGVRFEHDAWWQAVAVMPTDSAHDVDVRLHDPLIGTKDGFGAYHSISTWGAGQSDYVLANYNVCPATAYDAGVLTWNSGGDYTVNMVGSTFHGNALGTFGPFSLEEGQILSLHEFYFTTGLYSIDLIDSGGEVDWGMTLHAFDEAWSDKFGSVDGGMAWLAEAGQNESLTVEIPSDGYYCLSIWKEGHADLTRNGTFTLHILDGLSPADDLSVPSATRLVKVHPNPFNPITHVAFDLAHEQEFSS